MPRDNYNNLIIVIIVPQIKDRDNSNLPELIAQMRHSLILVRPQSTRWDCQPPDFLADFKWALLRDRIKKNNNNDQFKKKSNTYKIVAVRNYIHTPKAPPLLSPSAALPILLLPTYIYIQSY